MVNVLSKICSENNSTKRFFGFRRSKKSLLENTEKIVIQPLTKLKKLYKEAILPLETAFQFSKFHSASLTDTDLDAKPIVLCIGQYSTGKTSFVKYLIERDFPGLRIGPEPTTDRFVAVMNGPTEKIIPGNAAAAQTDKPFSALKDFGMEFLNKFECAELSSPILEKITLVDTPGVLAGSEQTKERVYNFPKVAKWFAERADRILLFFDANKLDISDEMKEAIYALKGNDDKIKCILNKADSVTSQQLLRVYGALMWSLGKTVKTPEVPRVYIGSFWDKPLRQNSCTPIFEAEEADLLAELRSLPRFSVVRKINELVKRAKTLRIHCLIVNHLREKIGYFNKQKRTKRLLRNMRAEFDEVCAKFDLPRGDFPSAQEFAAVFSNLDLSLFKKLNRKAMEKLEKALAEDIPAILDGLPNDVNSAELEEPLKGEEMFPENCENSNCVEKVGDRVEENGTTFDLYKQKSWAVEGAMKSRFDNLFDKISSNGGKIAGKRAKEIMFEANLSVPVMRRVWEWSDIDMDGCLDRDEFAVCMYLLELFKNGNGPNIDEKLPLEIVPPSKRGGRV